ncbi:MAG: metalloregulator ArsR/SmtB family transcription factor [Methanoregulaceae archaeon]|nr:metalloregulator ArsR/SmtB family transcription factor [Methanoregulaceae archaeon]
MAKNTIPGSIPDAIQEDLEKSGGIHGLVSRIPGDEERKSESRIHQALSDPIRLKIIQLLGVQPLCVCIIKEVIGIADSKLSYHLNVLKENGLIEGAQQKNWIIYSLTEQGTQHLPETMKRRKKSVKRKPGLECCEPGSPAK